MAKLTGHRYGKARVRVMKILREGPIHTLKDLEVAAYLKGDFASSYTSGDNSKVVATDTIKNTINVFAQQHLGKEIERFGLILGEHFLTRYEQVREAEIIQFCKDRMAAYKYPREVVFVPEIPKTATGKFLRRQLRDA